MSSVTPTIPAGVLTPANIYPKYSPAADAAPKQPPQAATAPQEPQERHHAASATASTALSAQALSSTDVSYVESLMGAIPAQKMEEILLKTGIPIRANLGPSIDMAA